MPGDLERVRGWFADGACRAPVAAAPSTVDVARALARAGGAAAPAPAAAETLRAAVAGAEQRVLVVVDGLGCALLERQGGSAFLRRQRTIELRAVFPSTTAAALTSLATGAWPAAHAVTGWFTRLPAFGLTATILPFVERDSGRPLERFGVMAADAFPVASLLEKHREAVHVSHPRAIADSVYTRYWAGARAMRHAYDGLDDAVTAIAERVRAREGSALHTLYVPMVDEAGHAEGALSGAVQAAFETVDAALERLHAALAGRARLLVTSDHGMIDVPEEARHRWGREDPLPALLAAAPSGEARAPLFHVRAGQHAAFAALFRERLGERFALLTPDDAAALHLFGPEPLTPETRRRVGDYVAVCAGPDIVLDESRGATGQGRLRGFHGGLTPDEMRIPLVVA